MQIQQTTRTARRQGFTLLELMLALALTAMLLGAVSMAVDLYLRAFESRRSFLEESQLARAVLRIIADDIRSVTLTYEQDMSSVEGLLGDLAGSAAAGALGDITGDDPPDGGSGGGDSGRGDTGSGDAGLGDIGMGDIGMDDLAGMAGEMSAEGDTSLNTTDLAAATTLPAQPGIYGNQYELQLDLSRLPRVDELQAIYSSMDSATLLDLPSDIKTVTYYVLSDQTGGMISTAGQALDLSQERDPNIVGHGLVRRQLDRAVTQWAMTSGNTVGLQNEGEVLAPEVVGIEFAYFDGYEWRTEWDSESEGGLPMAIQIILALTSDNATNMGPTTLPGGVNVTTEEDVRYYHLVVHIPTATPVEETTSDMTM